LTVTGCGVEVKVIPTWMAYPGILAGFFLPSYRSCGELDHDTRRGVPRKSCPKVVIYNPSKAFEKPMVVFMGITRDKSTYSS